MAYGCDVPDEPAPTIRGYHHVTLPTADVTRASDWCEQVFDFTRILIEEEEDQLIAVTLEHPSGVLLYLHQAPEQAAALRGFAVLSLAVGDQSELNDWTQRLAGLGIEHSALRAGHLGWVLDVTDPDGLHIQLHTQESVSADDL